MNLTDGKAGSRLLFIVRTALFSDIKSISLENTPLQSATKSATNGDFHEIALNTKACGSMT
jgi:hypothetical protein